MHKMVQLTNQRKRFELSLLHFNQLITRWKSSIPVDFPKLALPSNAVSEQKKEAPQIELNLRPLYQNISLLSFMYFVPLFVFHGNVAQNLRCHLQ